MGNKPSFSYLKHCICWHILLTHFICFVIVCSISNSFRITTNQNVDIDHLISGKTFQLESFDQLTDVEWVLPQVCQAQNSSAWLTSVICTGAGFYPITALYGHGNNETQVIQVRKSPLCYSWYVATHRIGDDEANNSTWLLHVWIIDPQHTSGEEYRKSAKQPSQTSKDVTQKMFRGGQTPSLEQMLDKRYQHFHIESTTFDVNYGYWIIELNMHFQYEMLLMVKGKPEVSVNGCLVRDTATVFSLLKFTNIAALTEKADTIKLTGSLGGKMQLIQDPCTSGVALLIQSDSVILTQNSFKTYSNLYLPRQILLDNSISDHIVKTAAVLPNDLLLLMSGNVIKFNTETGRFKAIAGLPASSTEFLKGRQHCLPDRDEQMDQIHAVSWGASTQILNMFYDDGKNMVSTDNLDMKSAWKLLEQLGFSQDFNVYIQDVTFHNSRFLGIVANVTDSASSAIVILMYNTDTEEWSHMPYWIEDTGNGGYSLMSLETANNAFLFWTSHQMHYSYRNGFNVGTMEIKDRNTSMLGSDDDSIQQVAVSVYGDIVILMHPSNLLYYGRIHQDSLIELPAFHDAGIHQTIFFNSLGMLHSLSNDSIPGMHLYPLALHVAGNTYPYVCKYRDFDHNSTADVYYLDLGRQLVLSARLTYPVRHFNTILVRSSSEAKIEKQIADSFEYYQGWQTLNRTVFLHSNANLYGVEDYNQTRSDATGDVILEMRPEITSLSCKRPVVMNAHISLGCPPGRHIRVHKPEVCQMPSKYTIPRSALQNADGSIAVSNVKANYSSDLGCPIVQHYKDNFLPHIDLYDGDVYIEQVPANFIIWEVSGRSDFAYTATMQEVGCQSTAQTWPAMDQESSTEPGLVWGPQNYRHCFCENMTVIEDLSLPYEILNSTGVNRIRWKTWRNESIFQFKLRVIDPQYSFCSLHASLGVRLVGLAPSNTPTNLIMQLSIGLFAVFTLSLGLVSYLFYRKVHIKEYQLQYAIVDDDDVDGGAGDAAGEEGPSVDIFNPAVVRKRHQVEA